MGGVAGEPRSPDWYRDPLGRHDLRYWDGRAWTEQVSDGGRPGTDAAELDRAGELAERGGDRRAPWPRWVAPAALAVAVVASVAGGGLGLLADRAGASPVVTIAVAAGALYATLGGFSWLVARRCGTGAGAAADFAVRWRWGDIGWGFVVSLGARVAAVAVTVPLALLDEDLVGTNTQSFELVDGDVALLVVLTLVALVVAPVLEELFFRGLLQRSLEAAMPAWVAIAVTSALFGLAHFSIDLGPGNVGVVAATAAAGAVFGLTVVVTRRLGRAMAAHAMFNVVPVLFMWATEF